MELTKEVPPPTTKGRTKYPFNKMEVGHSFAAPGEEYKLVAAAAYAYARRKGVKMIVRKDGADVRCWRIA